MRLWGREYEFRALYKVVGRRVGVNVADRADGGRMEAEEAVYPLLGTFSVLLLLYFNFSDHFNFPVLWLPTLGFVGTNSTRFVIVEPDGSRQSTLYINGWNSYWLMEESVWDTSRSTVSKMLKRGAEMGLSVCRTWAFNDGDGPDALQISPGVFNERVFRVRSFFRLLLNYPLFGC